MATPSDCPAQVSPASPEISSDPTDPIPIHRARESVGVLTQEPLEHLVQSQHEPLPWQSLRLTAPAPAPPGVSSSAITGVAGAAPLPRGRKALADRDPTAGQEGAGATVLGRIKRQTQLVSRDLDRQGQHGCHQWDR